MAILVQSNKKPSVSFPSQTGSIVTFNSQYAGLPLKSCVVNFDDETGIDSLDFSATGKNLLENKGATTTISGVTFTVNSDGTIALSGTSTSYFRYSINSALNLKSAKYTLSDGNTNREYDISLFAVTPNGNKHVNRITGFVTFEDRVNSVDLWISSGINTNGFIIKPMIERGETATTYEPFGDNKLFSFGKTIQNGSLNVLTGTLTTNDTTPPEVINLGGMDIETLQGENNLFASTGETTASYIKIGG